MPRTKRTKRWGGFGEQAKQSAINTAENVLTIPAVAAEGATGLTKKVIEKGFDTATVAHDSVHNTVQKSLAIIDASVNTTEKLTTQALSTTGNISTDALKATEEVSKQALSVVGEQSKNAASIINTSGVEGTRSINTAIQQSGNVINNTIQNSGKFAVQSLNTAWGSLQFLAGTAENAVSQQLQKVDARNAIMKTVTVMSEQRIEALRELIIKTFNDRLDRFIRDLTEYSMSQNTFIKQKLGLYKVIHCPEGKWWGRNCSNASKSTINGLKTELMLVQRRFNADISKLKSVKPIVRGALLSIYGQNPTEESFQESAKEKIAPYYQGASDLFTVVIDYYNTLSKNLDAKMNETLQEMPVGPASQEMLVGPAQEIPEAPLEPSQEPLEPPQEQLGGRRRKRRTKKRKLMRPRFRSRRS